MSTRVADVQAQAARALRLSLAFVVAAGALGLAHRRGLWLPLHLLVAGGLPLAISGAS